MAFSKMSRFEIPEERCLCHQERNDLKQKIRKILAEREVKPIETEKYVNVCLGPKYEEWTLKKVQENYQNSKEWSKVKIFSCIPNFEKRDVNRKEEENVIWKKYNDFLQNNNEDIEIAESLIQKDPDFKRFEAILTNETELVLKEHISEAMSGTPGLLLRSVHTDKVASQSKMGNHSALSDLGIEIPPYNCKNAEKCAGNNHKDECYRSENDFILLYVEGNNLCIRFVEVKRPNTTPWAKQEKKPGEKMTKYCLTQLEKGVKFMLSLIPDIPSSNLDIKAFSAFPETSCTDLFCQACQPSIISKEDVEQMKSDSTYLREKLSISQDIESPSSSGLGLLLAAASRLVGKSSLLHTGYRDLSDPFTQEKQTMNQSFDKMENKKTFWFLNAEQRDLLQNVNKSSLLRNFCFVGGSGTGKTQMALQVIRKLLDNYEGQKPIKLIMSSVQFGYPELRKYFEKQKFKDIEIEIVSLGTIVTNLDIVKEDYYVPGKKMYKMPVLIDEICKRFEDLHKEKHIIFFLDEILTFGNPEGLDWRNLKPGPSINLLLAFSPVSLEKGTKLMVSKGKDPEDAAECLLLPTDASFHVQELCLRYRNSRSIQKMTSFVGLKIGKYLTSDEEPATCVVGEKPVWIDIAEDEANIKPALEQLKKYIENDKKSEMVLLYDRFLSAASKEILNNLGKPRTQGGFGWKVMEERLFHGHECDTVIYVGSGHLEAFTRAKLKLLIVTFSEKLEDKQWYNTYQSALSSAVQEKLIKKEVLVIEQEVMDTTE
eukprot:GFUD01020691.1.p1 GENE.GFUD01020691.1~~GFUD01020691.1.p1  ORF type:complete len:768 (+),score=204.79 GFUD01020691.1:229-2532(+)